MQTDRFEPGGRPGWDTQPKVAALDTHTLDRIGERLVTSPLTTNPPYELLVALWRFVETGEVPAGARFVTV